MSSNRQLAINTVLTAISFVIGLAVTFFLTPYIVKALGRAAYGFIALSSTIIGYTGLMTIALNAMAGRFISINYIQGNIKEANKYFSSVFFSNLLMSGIISIMAIVFIVFINRILDVPDELFFDVRFLFLLLVINTILGLTTNIYGLGTFIKKRLDLSYSRQIFGTFIGTAILVSLFFFFPPHIWYFGINSLVISLYVYFTNRIFFKRLTPELRVSRSDFDFNKVAELVKSGSWNVLQKISSMLGQGFDLLFANLFVGAALMGTFSLSKTLSMMVLGLFGSFSGIFSPELTELYANGRINELVNELQKSIKMLSCFSTPILCAVYMFSGDFFRLWLPGQDYNFLYLLATLGFLASPFTLPYEGLWNIFTLTNKLKFSSLTLLGESIGVFSTVLLTMLFVEDATIRLIVLAGARTVWGILRSAFFLPMFGAHCLKLKLATFYKYEVRALFCLILSSVVTYILKQYLYIENWLSLIIAVAVCCIFAFSLNVAIVLNSSEKTYLFSKLSNRIPRIK